MRITFSVAIAVVLIGTVTGCSWRNDFTALSTKNVNLDSIEIDKTKSKGRVEGRSCQRVVVVFPIDFETPNADDAVDSALESANAQILLDAVLEYESFYIPLIYGRKCFFAEGDAYDTYQ